MSEEDEHIIYRHMDESVKSTIEVGMKTWYLHTGDITIEVIANFAGNEWTESPYFSEGLGGKYMDCGTVTFWYRTGDIDVWSHCIYLRTGTKPMLVQKLMDDVKKSIEGDPPCVN